MIKIHETNLATLDAKIEKLNRRFERNGIDKRFTYDKLGIEKVEEDGVVEVFHLIELNVPEIGYENKQLLGAVQIEEGGTILRMVPGMETPAGFERPDAHICEHCNVDRLRTKSYLVLDTETGEIKQVGSSCISLYLGVEISDLWALGAFTAEELAEMREPKHIGDGGGLGDSRRYSVRYLLRLGFAVSNGGRKFVSRSKAQEWEKRATVDEVMTIIHFRRTRRTSAETIAWVAEMREKAEAVEDSIIDEIIAEANGLPESDYAENLRVAVNSETLSARGAALAVSAVGAWFRITQKREASARMYEDLWIGKEKERLRDRECEVKLVYESENQWGTKTLLIFRDEETGAAIKWSATGCFSLNAGDKVRLTATVKGHAVYQGTKQTEVTRGKLEVI